MARESELGKSTVQYFGRCWTCTVIRFPTTMRAFLLLFSVAVGFGTALGAGYLDRCYARDECSLPYVCRKEAETDVYAKCRKRAKVGEWCTEGLDCKGQGTVCQDSVCVKPTGDLGSVCTDDSFCDNDLVCLGTSTATKPRECRKKPKYGEYCEQTSQCASELGSCRGNICIQSVGGSSDRCQTDRQCKEPFVCRRRSNLGRDLRCRLQSLTGGYCEFGAHCLVKEDGCLNGICTKGAERKGGGRGLSRSKIIGLSIGIPIVVLLLVVVLILHRRIKRSPQAALEKSQQTAGSNLAG